MSQGLNKPFRFDLTSARTGQGERVGVNGRFIRVVDVSDPSVECQISLEGSFSTTDFLMVNQAFISERQGFTAFHIKNEAQADQWVLLVVSDGPDDFDYQRPLNNTIEQIVQEVDTIDHGGDTLEADAVAVDDTAGGTLIVAADDDTTGLAIYNNSDEHTLYIGTDGVDEATGYPVPPQTSFGVDFRAAIYGIAPAGQTIDVRFIRGYMS